MKGRVRRPALLAFLLLGLGAARAQNNPPNAAPARPSLSPVILAEDPQVVQRFAVDDGRVRQMVDSELLRLTSASDLGVAWRRLGIVPTDIVGIKITTMGGPLLCSHQSPAHPGHLRRLAGRGRRAFAHHHLGQIRRHHDPGRLRAS